MAPFNKMTPEKKSLAISLIVYAGGIIVFFPFIFFNGWWYLLTGWLLGMAINLINYLLIIRQSHLLKQLSAGQTKANGLILFMYFFRFGLYVAGLVLVGLLHQNGLDYFNIFTTFGAYLVISAVIFLTGAKFQKPEVPTP